MEISYAWFLLTFLWLFYTVNCLKSRNDNDLQMLQKDLDSLVQCSKD